MTTTAEHIKEALKIADQTRAHAVLYGAKRAAWMLGIKTDTLYKRLSFAGLSVKANNNQFSNQGDNL